MLVDDLRRSLQDDACEISARVRSGQSDERRLWWRFPAQYAPDGDLDGSPFLAGVLVWAMRHGEDVTVDAPVSPRLLAGLDDTLAVFRSFFPGDMKRISVSAEPGQPPAPTQLTGCYFARGVDSWYAVLRALEEDPQRPPLSHAVFSPGFLSPHDTPESVRFTADRVTAAAARAGLPVVSVDTNLKWDFRGAQLVSTALALGLRRMLIPSGGMRGELRPRITHPEIDPRFSTERTEIVHYGDASRLEKVARVARSQDALDDLWVCTLDNPLTDVNCGRCEKCVRTMLQLHIVGALDRCPRFAHPLDAGRVAAVNKPIKHPHQWVDIAHALGDGAQDRRLAAAARLVVAHSELRQASAAVDDAVADPALAQVDSRLPAAARRAARLEASAQLFLRGDPATRLGALPHQLAHRLRASPRGARVLDSVRRRVNGRG